MDCKKVANWIVRWLDDKAVSAKKRGFVVGISGGIDSAVVSTLCALTRRETLCLSLPINQAPDQLGRADEHCNWLHANFGNVASMTIDLTKAFKAFEESLTMDFRDELSMANARSRIRMMTLYAAANAKNLLVAGTGNKVEDFGIGFCTKYGDSAVDLSPIGDLTKTEVRALAEYLGVCKSIQEAIPTDGLWGDNRSDEAQIGATYPELEWAMKIYDALLFRYSGNMFDETILSFFTPRQREVLKIYAERHEGSKHKMEMPPICKIS